MKTSRKLDLSSLEKALFQLQDCLEYYHANSAQLGARFNRHMRGAAIQAFEFTYELCWKMIKRYLEMTEPDPKEIELMSYNDLIRTASERGLLLSDLAVWKNYRKERGATSHTYDEEIAADIFANLPKFLEDAQYLLEQLKKR